MGFRSGLNSIILEKSKPELSPNPFGQPETCSPSWEQDTWPEPIWAARVSSNGTLKEESSPSSNLPLAPTASMTPPLLMFSSASSSMIRIPSSHLISTFTSPPSITLATSLPFSSIDGFALTPLETGFGSFSSRSSLLATSAAAYSISTSPSSIFFAPLTLPT